MKRFAILSLCGLVLTCCLNAPAAPKAADEKWLDAVQKMVAKGEHKVSTPSEERVNLLKTWAKEHGYSVKVTKTDAGYKIEVTKEVAQK